MVHILENREYTGCLVNFKTEKPSYKTKHSVENPIEKQAIFENHHEPIIDTQMWERVQELRKQRKRSEDGGNPLAAEKRISERHLCSEDSDGRISDERFHGAVGRL